MNYNCQIFLSRFDAKHSVDCGAQYYSHVLIFNVKDTVCNNCHTLKHVSSLLLGSPSPQSTGQLANERE